MQCHSTAGSPLEQQEPGAELVLRGERLCLVWGSQGHGKEFGILLDLDFLTLGFGACFVSSFCRHYWGSFCRVSVSVSSTSLPPVFPPSLSL